MLYGPYNMGIYELILLAKLSAHNNWFHAIVHLITYLIESKLKYAEHRRNNLCLLTELNLPGTLAISMEHGPCSCISDMHNFCWMEIDGPDSKQLSLIYRQFMVLKIKDIFTE